MKGKTIAITGANGFLGSELCQYFSKKGWHIRALVRHPEKYSNTDSIEYFKYDLGESFDESILKGVDYLVHTAYIKQSNKNPKALDINVNGARLLVKVCKKAEVQKSLFISSMSAHKDAVSVYGQQKLLIEKLFSGKGFVVLRPGLIIGRGGLVKQMVNFMRSKHIVPLVDNGKQPLQIIAVYDLINTIEIALLRKEGLFTIANPTVYSYKQFYEMVCKRFNIKVVFVPVPFFILFNILRLIAFLKLPLAVSTDNALGLKKLSSVNTENDLKRLNITVDNLEEVLQKIEI